MSSARCDPQARTAALLQNIVLCCPPILLSLTCGAGVQKAGLLHLADGLQQQVSTKALLLKERHSLRDSL